MSSQQATEAVPTTPTVSQEEKVLAPAGPSHEDEVQDELPVTAFLPAETTLALPGEAAVDEDLLDRAVSEINRIHTAKGLETARAIGNFVVQAFFEGDLDRFGQRERKHATFRALSQRADLHVSYTTIWYAVAVLDQLRQLPEDVGTALPLAHHKLLLPVKDPGAKVSLARQAVEHNLTSRDFAEEIKRARAREDEEPHATGRPPLPAFVKGLTRLRKAIELATSGEVEEATFASYSPEKARALAGELDGQIAALEQLKARVLDAAGRFEAGGTGG